MSEKMPPYCNDYLNRSRFATREVKIGNVGFGGSNPVRIQSMTTTDTMDTEASVEQSIRMIDAGCELVRLTAPSKKDAENLLNIKSALVERGYETPLVADIHFTPNAAEIAAKIVEKVRVNPGNYADKKRFEEIDYTDESYQAELDRIEKKFTPLVLLCKEEGTAMRIGTNHGSLSDRILSRYGDTPEGMVESAMEFLNICRKHDFHDIVLSMKASNTLVMVQAYRLLMATMAKHGMNYPIHLGVTEAGDGEDGRIKSAVGIGALLEDGIGDTVRVSLTEAPEAEIPVAQKLVDKFSKANNLTIDYKITDLPYNPYAYQRYNTNNVGKVGSGNVPVVIADVSEINEVKPSHLFGYGYMYSVPLDKWNLTDSAADFVYIGNKVLNFEVPGTLQVLCDLEIWQSDYQSRDGFFPIIDGDSIDKMDSNQVFFLRHNAVNSDVAFLKNYPNCVVILESEHANKAQLYRNICLKFAENGVKSPVILSSRHDSEDVETFQLWTSSDLGVSLIDGFGDGVWLQGKVSSQIINATSFGILQATRTRISKTEYISCPSCGRTLFDLQETTAKIRAKTSHLKGVKIGIMGCIVNGPGEMADADYGYVGTGPGKIHLYKEKEVVRKNVPEDEAVDALIDLIREHGDWLEPVS
ncbi:(E)-4-hydroxy-3-methylbut-2-enyl-diphosphate synthase [Crocinitomicaceae bacterium]|nr:(E)-4-hydroxy-3-methylbut-2-enyl-diphosphate synthase [Crocinitomicaceae bacterium]